MPAWTFVNHAIWLAQPIKFIINTCFKVDTFPSGLMKVDVVPIPKVNNLLSRKELRPKSLSSVMSEILEKSLIQKLEMCSGRT